MQKCHARVTLLEPFLGIALTIPESAGIVFGLGSSVRNGAAWCQSL
jgi:hypothetical protein